MKYPDHIYRKFEIIENDILGVKHYALVQVYNFLGFKIKVKRRVDKLGFVYDHKGWADLWHKNLNVLKETIERERELDEARYYRKFIS